MALHEGLLKINSDKSELEATMKTRLLNPSNEIEAKALNWLENGRVGASSGTICGTLFPNLQKHPKFANKTDDNDKFEIHWPIDNSDFDRCVKFFEAVPEAKARLNEIASLSKEWKGLVSNWDKIENLAKEDKREEAYNLIKESIGSKHRIKP